MTTSSWLMGHRLATGFDGVVCVLSGFIDATACPDNPKYGGVAAVLFDDAGLKSFEIGFAELQKEFGSRGLQFSTFHASQCCGGRGHEEFRLWDSECRSELCRRMAMLIASTKLAGFVTLCQQVEFDNLKKRKPGIAEDIGGALYPVIAFYTIESVASFSKKLGQKVLYWIEKGDDRQSNLEDSLIKIRDSAELRERFAFENYNIIPKNHENGGAMMAADFLAWECKRNYWKLSKFVDEQAPHEDDDLSDNFKIIRGSRGNAWFERHISDAAFEIQHLIRWFYGLSVPRK